VTERTSLWGLRALAICAALVVWFFASVQKRERVSEKLIDAAVTYNPPRGVILLDPLQTVKVRLRGPDRLVRALAPFAVDVLVELGQATAGTVDVHVSAENVLRPDGLEVMSIEPNTLRVRLDRELTRELPVLPRVVGEPAGGAVPRAIRAVPSSALVVGPRSLLDSLVSLTTSPIALDGHALTFARTVPVIATDPLIRVISPAAVTVQIEMGPPDQPGAPESGERDAGRR
jgi:YbbR domain-containing protein